MNLEEANEAFSDKLKRGIFNPVKRHIKIEHEAEDRWQDAVAQTWLAYVRYLKKGQILSDAILVHFCRLRATDLGRFFVPVDCTCKCQDVMDPRPYRDGLVTVYRLNGTHDEEQTDESDRAIEVSVAEALAIEQEDHWISAMDLSRWVKEQTFQDQAILTKKMEGRSSKDAAHELHLPYLVLWRKEKQLGQELADRACITIAKSKRRSRAS